jgi:2-oxoglutarate dehydrogenase E2 component (dihydrolipoamide succinyltransferase)
VLAFIKDWESKERPEPVLHMESPYVEESPAPKTEPAPIAAPAQPAPQPAPVAAGAGEPLSLMRKKIGDHMRHSLDTAAHCTTIVEADMSGIEAKRGKLSYLPFVARSVIEALREYPLMNATLQGDRITIHEEVNLGIAVSLGEKGLIVPVVHDAHLLSHEGLAAKVKDLAARARSGELQPDEVRGGTFTITNPGRYGALLATPIINQPQVAILDLEAVVKRPVVVGGDSIAIRPMTYLCMSWDHRALDGAYAAQFLSEVRARIEAWT